MMSLNLLVYGFTAPLVGGLVDRWKPRRVIFIGFTILILATVGCAFARELWHFYLLFGILLPVGTACCGWPLLSPTLANWFFKRRGLAMGLGQLGGGLSFTYALFADAVISQLGWRGSFFVLAGVLVVLPLPLYFFLYRYRPGDKGLKAYGAGEVSSVPRTGIEAAATSGSSPRDWTLRRAMKTYQLWLLIISHLLYWGVGCYMILAHQVKFAQDIGYSSAFAASIFALFGIAMAIGMPSSAISDWIGREKTITLAIILSIGAVLALILVQDTSQSWLLYVYAICFGYGAGLYATLTYVGAADIFYGRQFGAISGMMLTGLGIGGVLGPWLGGYIYDVSGSYTGAFILTIVCFGLSGVAYWMAAPRKAVEIRARALS